MRDSATVCLRSRISVFILSSEEEVHRGVAAGPRQDRAHQTQTRPTVASTSQAESRRANLICTNIMTSWGRQVWLISTKRKQIMKHQTNSKYTFFLHIFLQYFCDFSTLNPKIVISLIGP